MRIIVIAAVAKNGAIGYKNELPWNLPADQRFFLDQIRGHCLLMGSVSYYCRPDAPSDCCLVLSRNEEIIAPNVTVFRSFGQAIDWAKAHDKEAVYILGGAEVYREAIERWATEMILTEIDHEPVADVYFPPFDRGLWQPTAAQYFIPDAENPHAFRIVFYERKKNEKSS